MEANVVETWSHTKVEVVKVRHTWTISNFSYCVERTGEFLKSETFSAHAEDKVTWCLKLYPRGDMNGAKDYVSVFLSLVSCNKAEIEAKGKIAICNERMEELCSMLIDHVFKEGSGWGSGKFMKRDLLLDSTKRLLSDDKLTIFCEVNVVRNTVNVPTNSPPLTWKDPASGVLEDLELLLDTQKFSDVTLIAGGREFRAHKTILAARSAVFSAMFEHDMEERKHNLVNIIDMDDKVVEEMLRFIYTGKVPNIDKMADTLLVAADKYALDSLKLMCLEPLCESLAVENAVHILVLSDTHGCDWLKTQAVNFINKHTTAVMDTEGFKFAATSHPHLITEILRALAIKSNGEVDESMSSTINKEASQSHI